MLYEVFAARIYTYRVAFSREAAATTASSFGVTMGIDAGDGVFVGGETGGRN